MAASEDLARAAPTSADDLARAAPTSADAAGPAEAPSAAEGPSDPEPAAPPPAPPAERLTTPVELLWDLVFVFAVTQVTTLLALHLSWAWLGRSLLVLALVWWAWSAFVWAANAEEAGSPTLRAALLVALLPIFIVGLTIPEAFRTEAVLFTVAYAAVRFLHLALYADASRRGHASWEAIAGFAVTVAVGMALLIVGAFVGESWRIVLWIAAAAIDYAGPAWLTRERLRGLQRVAVAHFSERYGLFVIICLGESIVEIGVGANHQHIDAQLVVTIASGVLITVGMWWTYFDSFAALAAARLRDHDDPVLAAADGYSYLHLLIVAGIIVFAAGMRVATLHSGASLGQEARLALCGGVALYLAGHSAFRARMTGSASLAELGAAGAVGLAGLLGGGLHAWAVGAVVAAVLALLCA
ncbi:MAG: low temperature requirement protein A, partial [Actinomycetota bacterium]|nr:low temperature requirement protein A [Actinomycetota bacterium]